MMIALPAVLALLKFVVPIRLMGAVGAEGLTTVGLTTPPSLVIVAPPAVLAVLKLVIPPMSVMVALPAVLVSLKLAIPAVSSARLGLTPPELPGPGLKTHF